MVTVAKIVKQLTADALVEEVGRAPAGGGRSTGGRPVGILRLKSDVGFVAGLPPRETSSIGVVMDLTGEVVQFQSWEHQLHGLEDGIVDRSVR
jgi:hypothetical protein